MVSLLNPLPLISFQALCASPDVGVLSWNQFPRKTLKWKVLFQPLRTKLDCALVSRGVVCFCRVSLCRKVKWAGRGVSWAAFCRTLFMGIPRQMGTARYWAIQWGYGAVASLPSGISAKQVKTGANLLDCKTLTVKMEIHKEAYKRGRTGADELWSRVRSQVQNWKKIQFWQGTVWLSRCWLDVYFLCCWEGVGINQCQTSELMWNTRWSVTVWVMTALLSYKLRSQFDNCNGVLPGQIFVRRKRKLYVKLCRIYRMRRSWGKKTKQTDYSKENTKNMETSQAAQLLTFTIYLFLKKPEQRKKKVAHVVTLNRHFLCLLHWIKKRPGGGLSSWRIGLREAPKDDSLGFLAFELQSQQTSRRIFRAANGAR